MEDIFYVSQALQNPPWMQVQLSFEYLKIDRVKTRTSHSPHW